MAKTQNGIKNIRFRCLLKNAQRVEIRWKNSRTVNGVVFVKHANTAIFEKYIMKKSEENTIARVLKNIELIKQNREMIVGHGKLMNHFAIKIKGLVVSSNCQEKFHKSDDFVFYNGACYNADLYALDTLETDDLYSRHISRMWLKRNGSNEFGLRTALFPIDRLSNFNNWLNPERWEYLDFVETYLKNYIKNN